MERAPCILLVLCGLPGAGKSTLAQALLQYSDRQLPEGKVEVHHVRFDDPLEQALKQSSGDFSPEAWQASRKSAMERLEMLLHTADSRSSTTLPPQPGICDTSLGTGQGVAPALMRASDGGSAQASGCISGPGRSAFRLVVADDNMQYRSMRYKCCQAARACGAAFCQVYVSCPLQRALAQNALRQGLACVPEASICRMSEVLEPPDPARHPWEGPVLSIESENLSQWVGERLWSWLVGAWGPCVPPKPSAEEEEQRKAIARAATADNAIHNLDICTRQMLSAWLSSAPKGMQASWARKLNDTRRSLLSKLRSMWPHADTAEAQSLLVDVIAVDFASVLSAAKTDKWEVQGSP